MTKETPELPEIPVRIILDYMAKVNNLLNNLIREDNFPTLLFAKNSRSFHDILRISQILNFKYHDEAVIKGKLSECSRFMDNISKWEKEYKQAINDRGPEALGLESDVDEQYYQDEIKDLLKDAPKDLKDLEAQVKSTIGENLFNKVLDKIHSSSRKQSLDKIMNDLIENNDFKDKIPN